MIHLLNITISIVTTILNKVSMFLFITMLICKLFKKLKFDRNEWSLGRIVFVSTSDLIDCEINFNAKRSQGSQSSLLLFTINLSTSEDHNIAVVDENVGEGDGSPLQYSCLENAMDAGAWWAAVHGVAKSWTRLSDFTFTFHFHALEKEVATHSSVLAWRIPGTGEPGGLPSLGLHRVGHD